MDWRELAESVERRKKQSEEAERVAKRQAVDDVSNSEKMEVGFGELDLIDEPNVWEQGDLYDAEGGPTTTASSIRRPCKRRGWRRSRS